MHTINVYNCINFLLLSLYRSRIPFHNMNELLGLGGKTPDNFLVPLSDIAGIPSSGDVAMQRFQIGQNRQGFRGEFQAVGREVSEYFALLGSYAYDNRTELGTGNHHYLVKRRLNPFQERYRVSWVDQDDVKATKVFQELQFRRRDHSNVLEWAWAQFGDARLFNHAPPQIEARFNEVYDLTRFWVYFTGINYPKFFIAKGEEVFENFLKDYCYTPVASPWWWSDEATSFGITVSAENNLPVELRFKESVSASFRGVRKYGFDFSDDPDLLRRVFPNRGMETKFMCNTRPIKISDREDMKLEDLLKFVKTCLRFFPARLTEAPGEKT